jgi:GNAT superfamily N-acetyltransferase
VAGLAAVRRGFKRTNTLIDLGGTMKKEKTRSPLRIQPGRAADVPIILEMIRGLAQYERLAHQVTATAARLRAHGFGRSPYFRTLIGRRGQQAVGFALYFFAYSTFLAQPTLYVEDIYVLPEERGQGAGRALLSAMARIAVQRKCGRMEWAVLDWNTPAIQFYKSLGAGLRRDWILTRLTGPSLLRLARAKDAKS